MRGRRLHRRVRKGDMGFNRHLLRPSTCYPRPYSTVGCAAVKGACAPRKHLVSRRERFTTDPADRAAAAAGQGGGPHAEVGTASSTGGGSGAAVTGLAGFVTPSEPFFAGDLAGVEALSESASLSTSARVGELGGREAGVCLLYTSPSPRDATLSRMPSSA